MHTSTAPDRVRYLGAKYAVTLCSGCQWSVLVLADAGWDMKSTTLAPELRRMIVRYGEMVQANYDNLGQDRCQAGYGKALKPPEELLSYLTADYPLPETASKPVLPGTRDK